MLSGTPTRAGSFTVWVAAFNVLGASLGQPVTIDVARAPLTITANDKQIGAGDPLPAFDATVTGLLAGDTLDTAPTCTSTGSGPGTHTIACSGAADPNYTITYKTGTLTINPAPTPSTPRPGSRSRRAVSS